MKRTLKILLVVAALAAVAGAPSTASPAPPEDDPSPATPKCRAVTETVSRGDIYPSSSPRTNVGFRLRCNFAVNQIYLRTDKRLERVYERPRLERPDPEDELSCRRISKTVGRCLGEVGEDVRILGALRVRGGPCGRDRLGTLFRVQGGVDCEPGEACIAIGYEVKVRVEQPRGC